MEKQSQNNASRRHRSNRSGGGNRNRNRSGGNRNGNRSGGNNRNRNRNRSRRRQTPKPTAWQKFLQIISFGKLGQPKRRSRRKQQPKQKTSPANVSTQSSEDSPNRRRQRNEVTSGRLYVGNLTYATTEEELEELFRGSGTVISAEVVTNSRTQQSKGFAFVEMASIDEAKRAVEILDNKDFMGRKITVNGARSEGPKAAQDAPDQPVGEITENTAAGENHSEVTTQVEAPPETSPETVSEATPAEDSAIETSPEKPLGQAEAEPEGEKTEQETTA